MTEFEIVRTFISFEKQLKNYGYSVSAIKPGFYIHNSKGTIVAECQTVDGLRAFFQAVEYLTPTLTEAV